MKYTIILLSTVAVLALSDLTAYAEEGCLLVLDKDKIAPGKQAALSMTVKDAADMPVPEMPFINGLAFKYQKTEKKNRHTVYIYRIVALKEGAYHIGPVTLDNKGRRYVSNVVTLSVSRAFIPTEEAAPALEEPGSLKGHVYIVVDKPAGAILINQKMPITVKLFSDWFDVEDITISDIVSTDLVVEKFQKGASAIVTENGTRYAVLEHKGSVLAPSPGIFTIEPIKVSLYIARRRPLQSGKLPDLLNDNEVFYDKILGPRERMPLELMTEPIAFEVSNLPVEGRPESFRGAIGLFDMKISAEPTKLKEGDILTLSIMVTGAGNFNTITAVDIPKMTGFKTFEPKVTRSDNSYLLEQTMRLTGPGTNEVPRIIFSFFDPASGKYVSLERGPIHLSIGPFEKKDGVSAERSVIEDIIPVKNMPGRITGCELFKCENLLPVAPIIFPLIILCISVLVKKRIDFLNEHAEYARWLRALKDSSSDIARLERLARSGDPGRFYSGVFTVMRGYLGLRLFLPSQGITEKTVADILGDRIEDKAVLESIREIFSACHIARFTDVKMEKEDMAKTFSQVRDVLEYFNRRTYILNRL